MYRCVFVFMLLATLSISSMALAQEDPVLTVDAGSSLGPISPYVYGSNLYYSVIPPDLMPQAQALGLKYLRWGSSDSDRRNVNKPQLDLFILQARQLGAEPAVTVRLLGGTPEEAAEIVRYVNIEKNHNVRYWSIGNEPNLFADWSGEPYTTEDLNRQWRAIAEAMLMVDPDIRFIGPDITQYVVLNTEGSLEYLPLQLGGHALDSAGRDWLREFLRANGDLVDVVSIHRYPYPGASGTRIGVATMEGLRANAQEWDRAIPNLRKVIRDAAGRDIPIAITEINSNSSNSSGGEAGMDTLYNAIWFADVLGRLIRHQVEIVAYWDLRGDAARSWGLMGVHDLRPTYYIYLLYGKFGTQLVETSGDDDVSIYGALREDGSLSLMVINLSSMDQRRRLALHNYEGSGPAEVWRLDSEHLATQLEDMPFKDGMTLDVPAASVTLYIVPKP